MVGVGTGARDGGYVLAGVDLSRALYVPLQAREEPQGEGKMRGTVERSILRKKQQSAGEPTARQLVVVRKAYLTSGRVELLFRDWLGLRGRSAADNHRTARAQRPRAKNRSGWLTCWASMTGASSASSAPQRWSLHNLGSDLHMPKTSARHCCERAQKDNVLDSCKTICRHAEQCQGARRAKQGQIHGVKQGEGQDPSLDQ